MTEREARMYNNREEQRLNDVRYREMIAQGLKACAGFTRCGECPYYKTHKSYPECEVAMLNDAYNIINKELTNGR